ncbi:hypothetical protein TTRE_0000355401 [Trichuris trichiura]|uniref:EGF-like domain-containing protein n=1 Tax=Trichuris trichiura TaxID=36087 RepID=A0A077Z482_TRITR|nr:hypothetical protein TTRE_0000355401 [Trichuris trichiura]
MTLRTLLSTFISIQVTTAILSSTSDRCPSKSGMGVIGYRKKDECISFIKIPAAQLWQRAHALATLNSLCEKKFIGGKRYAFLYAEDIQFNEEWRRNLVPMRCMGHFVLLNAYGYDCTHRVLRAGFECSMQVQYVAKGDEQQATFRHFKGTFYPNTFFGDHSDLQVERFQTAEYLDFLLGRNYPACPTYEMRSDGYHDTDPYKCSADILWGKDYHVACTHKPYKNCKAEKEDYCHYHDFDQKWYRYIVRIAQAPDPPYGISCPSDIPKDWKVECSPTCRGNWSDWTGEPSQVNLRCGTVVLEKFSPANKDDPPCNKASETCCVARKVKTYSVNCTDFAFNTTINLKAVGCVNDGTLGKDSRGHFMCMCTDRYNGIRCEHDVCEGKCKNAGTCIPGMGKPKCICRRGYTGGDCTEVVISCGSKGVCENGGSCITYNMGREQVAYCNCKKGYGGANCEHSVETCEENSCNYHGVCTENKEYGTIECTCYDGFSGQTCNFDKRTKKAVDRALEANVPNLLGLVIGLLLGDDWERKVAEPGNDDILLGPSESKVLSYTLDRCPGESGMNIAGYRKGKNECISFTLTPKAGAGQRDAALQTLNEECDRKFIEGKRYGFLYGSEIQSEKEWRRSLTTMRCMGHFYLIRAHSHQCTEYVFSGGNKCSLKLHYQVEDKEHVATYRHFWRYFSSTFYGDGSDREVARFESNEHFEYFFSADFPLCPIYEMRSDGYHDSDLVSCSDDSLWNTNVYVACTHKPYRNCKPEKEEFCHYHEFDTKWYRYIVRIAQAPDPPYGISCPSDIPKDWKVECSPTCRGNWSDWTSEPSQVNLRCDTVVLEKFSPARVGDKPCNKASKTCCVARKVIKYNASCTDFAFNTTINLRRRGCIHGGKIGRDSRGHLMCMCTDRYNGIRCEHDVCEGKCKNGGTCIPGRGKSTCICRKGYTGNNCAEVMRSCGSKGVCENGGSCFRGYIGAEELVFCKCKQGYGGANCEHLVETCTADTCNNNGVCLENSEYGTVECKCDPKYEGERCNKKRENALHERFQPSAKNLFIAVEERENIMAVILSARIFHPGFPVCQQKLLAYFDTRNPFIVQCNSQKCPSETRKMVGYQKGGTCYTLGKFNWDIMKEKMEKIPHVISRKVCQTLFKQGDRQGFFDEAELQAGSTWRANAKEERLWGFGHIFVLRTKIPRSLPTGNDCQEMEIVKDSLPTKMRRCYKTGGSFTPKNTEEKLKNLNIEKFHMPLLTHATGKSKMALCPTFVVSKSGVEYPEMDSCKNYSNTVNRPEWILCKHEPYKSCQWKSESFCHYEAEDNAWYSSIQVITYGGEKPYGAECPIKKASDLGSTCEPNCRGNWGAWTTGPTELNLRCDNYTVYRYKPLEVNSIACNSPSETCCPEIKLIQSNVSCSDFAYNSTINLKVTGCKNGGTLGTDGYGQAVCHCTDQFNGTECENDVCSGYCLNEARCTASLGKPSCFCQRGFIGTTCEGLARSCGNDKPCQNGGTCTQMSVGNKKIGICRCPTSHGGVFCEVQAGNCSDESCNYAGECVVDTVYNTVRCICYPGYAGEKCEPEKGGSAAKQIKTATGIAINVVAGIAVGFGVLMFLFGGTAVHHHRRKLRKKKFKVDRDASIVSSSYASSFSTALSLGKSSEKKSRAQRSVAAESKKTPKKTAKRR